MKNKVINLPTTYSVDKSKDYTSENLTKVILEFMHNGLNYNSCEFSLDSMNKDHTINSLKNLPILGYIKNDDFDEHNMTYDEEKERMNYHEQVIGVVPESNNYRYIEKDGLTYAVVDGYIFNTYAQDALDIINENEETKVSMEIKVNSVNFKDNDVMDIIDYIYTGITCLGRDVQSGMKNSILTVDKFSQKEEFQQQFEEVKQTVNFALNKDVELDNNSKKEEENFVTKNKAEIAKVFKLTANQLGDELNSVLSKETFEATSYWGEDVERCSYWMQDYDEVFVYAVDVKDEMKYVKIPYSKDGDNVSFDYDDKKRIKYVPMDWEGSEEDTIDMEMFASHLEKEFSIDAQSKQDEIESKINEFIELNDKFVLSESKVKELESNIAEKETVITELSSFKQKVEDNEKSVKIEELFSKLSKHFTIEESNEWKEKSASYENVGQFEKDIKSFAFDKLTKKDKEDTVKVFVSTDLPKNKEASDSDYVFDRYKN